VDGWDSGVMLLRDSGIRGSNSFFYFVGAYVLRKVEG
jgi:hypothetical protein